MPTSSVNIFVSYSHQDSWFLKEKSFMASAFKILEQKGADVWWDKEINAGENWNHEIQERLEDADIAVCLISLHFLASDYIRKVRHLQRDLRPSRKAGGEATEIPEEETQPSDQARQGLGGHLKTGHTWTLQNRPTERSQDIDHDVRFTLRRDEQCLERRKEETSHRLGPARLDPVANSKRNRRSAGDDRRVSESGRHHGTATGEMGPPTAGKTGHRSDHRTGGGKTGH